jgi:hypothetical protein
LTRASLETYLPLFDGRPTGESSSGGMPLARGSAPVPFGTLQPANIAAMSNWMVATGLIHAPISPARYGTNRFLR